MPFAPPASDLAPRVALVWSTAPAARSGIALEEFLPDPAVNLIVRLSASGCRMVLLGPVTERAAVELAGGAEYFGVRFRAGQAPRLADAVPGELTNTHVDVDRIGAWRVDAIGDRLRSLPDFASRQRFIESLVRDAAPLVREARCQRLCTLLEARGGQLRVDDLAGELELTTRTIERLVREHFGMSPKRLIRLVRLRGLLERLHAGDFETLAALAYECGYADQSHMIRDFKALTGRLPGDRDALRTRAVVRASQVRVVGRVRTDEPRA